MRIPRRILPASLALLAQRPARAQGRTVTVIVPFSAGSGPDLIARLFADWCQRRLGQVFVVENRVGASGNIGTSAVARATPDGLTLLVTANTIGMNVSLFRNLPYDPVASFAPVAVLVNSTFALIAPSAKVASLEDLLAQARARPGAINYASPGVGTPHHLAMELFSRRAGIELTHIPYRGVGPAIADVLGGQVSAMFVPANVAAELARDGRVRLLAVVADARVPVAPNTPTLAEQGISGVDVDNWWGVLAPAGTPTALIARYNAAANEMLADPETGRFLAAQGLVPRGGPPEILRDQIAADLPRWAAVVRDARITPE